MVSRSFPVTGVYHRLKKRWWVKSINATQCDIIEFWEDVNSKLVNQFLVLRDFQDSLDLRMFQE